MSAQQQRTPGPWVYVRSGELSFPLWTVGFYGPDGKWEPESDWPTDRGAADRVHYLNGGDDALVAQNAQLVAALTPLADIPLEDFGWETKPSQAVTGWNKHTIYVRDVFQARAALAAVRQG